MTKTVMIWIAGLLVFCALAAAPGLAAEEAPKYTNQQMGFSLPLSEDVRIFTPDNPGPFTLGAQNLAILVNKWQPSDLIMVNLSEVADEKGLADLKSGLESQGLPQAGYRKIAVRSTNIGKNQEKSAVEHIFDVQGQTPRTMRQVSFIHRGKGFALVCTANTDHFQKSDEVFFEPVLRSIIFE
jgi:hypothetical protein